MLKRMIGIVVVGAICAALAGCASGNEPQNSAKDSVASEQAAKEAPAEQAKPNPPTAAPAKEQELRAGKADITVLVLNASGEEGAAGEAAEDIEALGFEHVTVDNATYHQKGNRVSYHHEEHRAEVDEVAALFDSLPPYDPYCYEDAWTGGWSMDYDILVMLGEPGAIYPVPA
ncbi:LytR C-terminal domain-containing protein [Eggerthella sinensis]|uniref:LytR C-terminal domain-containing protein n=1 Tax=Eggerthella sinensis TaxID=242230 RepID=UPI00248DCB7C|nr:LytR C-terminal domain-containing protein [Eggerthella sinensis]